MFKSNGEKTTFMMDTTNYYYSVMEFDLKNVEATYQRLMDKIFVKQLKRNLEVYVMTWWSKARAPLLTQKT